MGQIAVEISHRVIEAIRLPASLRLARHGALATFEGKIRDHNEGFEVIGIDFDCHQNLALETIREICAEFQAGQKMDCDLYVHHRIGFIRCGETSVYVAAASPHRKAALGAVEYVIDELKRRAPIWKQERYKNGNTAWLKGNSLVQRE